MFNVDLPPTGRAQMMETPSEIAVVFGTRPEAVKLAPVGEALVADPRFSARVIVTAQHREMLDQVLDLFEIEPDHDLDIMKPGQTLTEITARALSGLAPVLAEHRPAMVAVQGDTTTTFCGALAAFYEQIPVAHLEAGLRTGDPHSPFPEEINRRMTTRLTDLHLAPTDVSAANLLREGVDRDTVIVTGNTVIDALEWTASRAAMPLVPEIAALDLDRRVVLVTAHRRESLDGGMERIAGALADIAAAHPDVVLVFPIHRNPAVRSAIVPVIGELPNVVLTEPLDYPAFTWMLQQSHLVLTDSGGVQEEAPSLGKPVVVLRDTTERPEAVAAGTTRLVGTDRAAIVDAVTELLGNPTAYAAMSNAVNPFGDGRASERTLDAMAWHLGIAEAPPVPFQPGVLTDVVSLESVAPLGIAS